MIQAASQRALANGTTTRDVFAIARAIRERSEIPLIAFSYLNPILRYGPEAFARDAAAAGIDSLLLTDLPPESGTDLREAMHEHGLGTIFLLAPTSADTRIRTIDRASDGFVYYVSTTGVTGMRSELDPSLLTRLDEVRAQPPQPDRRRLRHLATRALRAPARPLRRHRRRQRDRARHRQRRITGGGGAGDFGELSTGGRAYSPPIFG